MRPLLFLSLLLSTCIIHTNGFSVCNDVDLNFVISSDLLSVSAFKVSEFINHIIEFASSEEAGLSIIFYGDIPESYVADKREILLALKDTYSEHDRNALKTVVSTTLQEFQDDLYDPNVPTIPYSRAEALTEISTQAKPTRNHFTQTQIGSSAGAHDDNDFYFIFDLDFGMENTEYIYISDDPQFELFWQSDQEVPNDFGPEPDNYEIEYTVDDTSCLGDLTTKVNSVCGLLNTYSSSTSSINFVSYQEFPPADNNFPYYKKIRCLDYDSDNGHPQQNLDFISLGLFDDPEELAMIYKSSCPSNYSIVSLGDVSFNESMQWIDANTVIDCDLTYITLQEYQQQNNIPVTEQDRPFKDVLDPLTSFIYVKDIKSDENTFREQTGLMANDAGFNALPQSCAEILMKIETIKEIDLNAPNLPSVIVDAVANDVDFDPLQGDKILQLFVASVSSPDEYMLYSNLNAAEASEEEGFEISTSAIRRRLLLLKEEQDLIRVVANNGRKLLLDYSIDIGFPELTLTNCGRRCKKIRLDWEATFSASGGFSHEKDPWEISIEGELSTTLSIWIELQLNVWSNSRFIWAQFPFLGVDKYDIRAGFDGYYEVGFSYDISLEASLTFTVEPLFRYIYNTVIMAGPVPIQVGFGINTDLEISWADPENVFVFEAGVTCTHRDVFELGFEAEKDRRYVPTYGVLKSDTKVTSSTGRGIHLGAQNQMNLRECAMRAYHYGEGAGLDCHIFQYGIDGCICQKKLIDALGIRGTGNTGNTIYILEHGNCAGGSTCSWWGSCWRPDYWFESFKIRDDGRCGIIWPWTNDGQRSQCSYCGNRRTGQGGWKTISGPTKRIIKYIHNEISECEPIWDYDPAHFCDLSFGVDITLSPSFVIVFYQIVEAGIGLDIIGEIRINLPETNPSQAISGANCNSEYDCTAPQIDGSLSIEIKAQLFYSFIFDITRLLSAVCPDCEDITFSVNGYEVNTEDAELSKRENWGPEFVLLSRKVLICFPLVTSHVDYIYRYCCDDTREPSPGPTEVTEAPTVSPTVTSKAPTVLNNLVSLRLKLADASNSGSRYDTLYIKIAYGNPIKYSPWFHISEDWQPGTLRFISEFDQYRNQIWIFIYFFDYSNANGLNDNLKISYIEYRDVNVADGNYIKLGKTDGTKIIELKPYNKGCRRMTVSSGGLSGCYRTNNPYVNPVTYDPTETPTYAPSYDPTKAPTYERRLTILTSSTYIKTIEDTIFLRLGYITDTSYVTDWIKLESTSTLWTTNTEYEVYIFDGYDSHIWTHLWFQNNNTQQVVNGNEIFEISGIQCMNINDQFTTIGWYDGVTWLSLDSGNNGCKGIALSSGTQVDCPDCNEQFYDIYSSPAPSPTPG